MDVKQYTKSAFVVIGKEGSTADGPGFIARLWEDANSHFVEVQHLAKRDAQGNLCGIWGAMSDPSRQFLPWEENFTRGLYLAGVECTDNAEPPAGWAKWTVPGFTYLCAESGNETFSAMLAYLREHDLPLAGAVQDFTCPQTGKSYMLFPIQKL